MIVRIIILRLGRVVRLMVRKKLIKKRFLKLSSDFVSFEVFLCWVNMILKISVLRLFLMLISLNK